MSKTTGEEFLVVPLDLIFTIIKTSYLICLMFHVHRNEL